ncbi:MAG TPA: tyrosine-type recombinase/integrase [Candidatus Angelobacter sp.]|jgi:integrase|nr:tyrosine-type recombinase/integrase [Candidatus Angelobacter sp.]
MPRRTTGKRANGEGTIARRSDGRWVAAVTLSDGTRRFAYGKTRDEVARKLRDMLHANDANVPIPGRRETVDSLMRSWLDVVKTRVRQRTWERYEQLTRVHVTPALGRVKLGDLTAQRLERFYADRLATGLSARTVRHLHVLLHAALRQAMRWDLVARNVADLAKAPRPEQKEMAVLTPDQVERFVAAARGDRLEALYIVAVTTGMRAGELLALRWADVDLDNAVAVVRRSVQRSKAGATGDRKTGLVMVEPKTKKSRRPVALSQGAVRSLRAHRAAQAAERLVAGDEWDDQDLVFPNRVGRPMEGGDLLNVWYRPLLKRAGLPRLRFHDLRHTAATLLLAAKVSPKVAQELLGHSTVAFTLDQYSHVIEGMQREAAGVMDALLGGGI